MDNIQKISVLKQVSFAKFLEEAELWYLLSECENISLNAGEVLFEEGSFKESMFVILDGELEIYKKNKQIALRGKGEFIGEMSILESKARSASVRAITDSVVLEIDENTFLNFLSINTKVVWDILKTLSHRNRTDLDSIDLAYKELKRSEEEHRSILESMSDLVFKVDLDGIIYFANSAVKTLGYSVGELIGKHFSEIYNGKLEGKKGRCLLTQRSGSRSSTNIESELLVNPDSEIGQINWYLPFLINSDGLWDVPQEMVLKKDTPKNFIGTLLVARSDKMDLIV